MKKRAHEISFFSGLAIFFALAGAAWAADCGDTTGGGGTDVACSCGDTVTTDTLLLNPTQAAAVGGTADPVVFTGGADPVCPGNGLIVAAGVTLDLNGNTISGDNGGVGLTLGGDDVTVKNGRVTKFATGVSGTMSSLISKITANSHTNEGIKVVGDLNKVSDSKALKNGADGILVQGNTNQLLRNTASQNPSGRGINVDGNGNILKKNNTNRNGLEGINLVGDDNTLDGNQANKNAIDGINVDGNGNILQKNRASGNDNDGIDLAGDNNTLEKNLGALNNTDGIHVSGDGNSLTENRGIGNGDDGIQVIGAGTIDGGGNLGKQNADEQCIGVACP